VFLTLGLFFIELARVCQAILSDLSIFQFQIKKVTVFSVLFFYNIFKLLKIKIYRFLMAL